MMAANIVNVAEDGDVILIVGQSDNTVKLKVDSHMLRKASKTFRVMFGPDFDEGQDLSHTHPKDILLSDDDADAMETICNFIHFKHYKVPSQLDSKRVFQIARVVDKYSLHETLKFAVKSWLQLERVQGFVGLSNMLKSAMLLKQPAAYRTITKALVLDCSEPHIAILDGENPESLIDAICE